MIKTKSGKSKRKCPACSSTRLNIAEGEGIYCLRCHYINKRRYEKSENLGKVSYITYS